MRDSDDGRQPGRSASVTGAVLLAVFAVTVWGFPFLGTLCAAPLGLAAVVAGAIAIGKGDTMNGALVIVGVPVAWFLAVAIGIS